MSIVHYHQLRSKGFRAIIAFEIAKLGKRVPVFPKEEFQLSGKMPVSLSQPTGTQSLKLVEFYV